MFAFLCPIRHPKSSNDYQGVIDCLKLTIESVCNQYTNQEFVFLVVCNEIPNIKVNTDIVKFLVVDFPPPDSNVGSDVPMEIFTYDKGTKLAQGLLELRKYNPDYLFIIDGDDWINNKVVEVVNNLNADLIYVNEGYNVDYYNKTYVKKYGICRYCGSTFIYKYKLLLQICNLNKVEVKDYTQNELRNIAGEYITNNILGNHRYQINYFKRHGFRVKSLDFPAICWVLNTGQNHSMQTLGTFGVAISDKFLKVFGVTSVSLTNKNIKIKHWLLAMFVTFKSKAGWFFADKKQEKI